MLFMPSLSLLRAPLLAALASLVLLPACILWSGDLGDECSSEDDCSSDYSCVICSGRNTCYFSDQLHGPKDYEWACTQYGSGTPTDPRYSGSAGGVSGDSGAGGAEDCSQAWTCTYDGQATTMCEAACAYRGTQREQTCAILGGYVEASVVQRCCTVCR